MPMQKLTETIATINIGIDPVPIHIGRLSVHWYGIMYALAFVAGFYWGVLPHLIPRKVPRATVERLTAWTILCGLLGARLYYVIQQPDLREYLTHPLRIISVWEGGMAFFGAIFAGLAAIWVLANRSKLSFWLLADAGVIFACIGQPIGRIGNIINGDILGARSNLPWATAYTVHTSASQCAVLQPGFNCGFAYQPAALYEALGTLVILAGLIYIRRRGVRDGVLALTYVGAYATSQLLLFQFRKSEPTVLLGMKQAQLTALVILLVGMPALFTLWRRSPESSAPPPPPPPRRVRAPRPARPPAATRAPAPAGTGPGRGAPRAPAGRPGGAPGKAPAAPSRTDRKGPRPAAPSGSPPPPAPLPPPPPKPSG